MGVSQAFSSRASLGCLSVQYRDGLTVSKQLKRHVRSDALGAVSEKDSAGSGDLGWLWKMDRKRQKGEKSRQMNNNGPASLLVSFGRYQEWRSGLGAITRCVCVWWAGWLAGMVRVSILVLPWPLDECQVGQ